jgi:hypothetical protein
MTVEARSTEQTLREAPDAEDFVHEDADEQ